MNERSAGCKTLIVTGKIPRKRESNGRHSPIPEGLRITILDRVQRSENGVRFSAGPEGMQETFTASPDTIERCCAIVKLTVPKAG
jgi:hypothetical protein